MSAGTVVEKVVIDELEREVAKAPAELKAAVAKGVRAAIRNALEGEPAAVRKPLAVPRRFLAPLGAFRRAGTSDAALLEVMAEAFEAQAAKGQSTLFKAGFAKRFKALRAELTMRWPTIAEATNWKRFMIYMSENEGAKLPRARFDAVVTALAGDAGEDVVLSSPQLLEEVDALERAMEALAADSKRLAQLGLASLDPRARIYVRTYAPQVSGRQGRYKYVDALVDFAGVPLGDPKGTRNVVGMKVEAKLLNVGELVTGGEGGKVGQLRRGELRGALGPWGLEEVVVPRAEIIDDPRIRKLLSFGSRDLTDAERAQLAADGILVKHFVHDVAHGDFFGFARDARSGLGIGLAK